MWKQTNLDLGVSEESRVIFRNLRITLDKLRIWNLREFNPYKDQTHEYCLKYATNIVISRTLHQRKQPDHSN